MDPVECPVMDVRRGKMKKRQFMEWKGGKPCGSSKEGQEMGEAIEWTLLLRKVQKEETRHEE